MTCHLVALCFDANDPLHLARFWSGVLGWELADDGADGLTLLPVDDTGFRLRFLPTDVPKTGPNQMHFDLTSRTVEDQQQTVARALELGGRHIDIGQLPEEAAQCADESALSEEVVDRLDDAELVALRVTGWPRSAGSAHSP